MNYDDNAPDSGAPCVDYSAVIGIYPSSTTGGVGPTRSDTWMSFDDNIRSVSDCNTLPLLGPSSRIPNTGAILENYYVNETDRGTVAPNNVDQLNANRQTTASKFVTWTDPLKTTNKEISEQAYIANPNRESLGTAKFVTWTDNQKTTLKEMSEVAYTANPERQRTGTAMWTFEDPLKTTTRETTQFSHAGGLGPATRQYDMSRFQYTGPEDQYEEQEHDDGNTKETFSTLKRVKAANTGGAKTYSIRGATLVTDYFPGAGRFNVLQDPDQAYGKINFKQKNDSNTNGPSSYLQSIPNASYMQNNQILAGPRPSSNRLFDINDRQTASYQVQQLKANPLSPFTNNPGGIIPPLMSYNEPDTYTSMTPGSPEDFKALLDGQVDGPSGGIGGLYPVSVYPLNGNVATPDLKNPVMNIFKGLGYGNEWNPMLEQGSSRHMKEPKFSGSAYSGRFEDNVQAGQDNVYGPNNSYAPIEQGMIGMEYKGPDNTYCDGNRALGYAMDDFVINRDLY